MTRHDNVRAQLHAIEAVLRQHQLWQAVSPQPEAFSSNSLSAWIRLNLLSGCNGSLIPRMHALLDGGLRSLRLLPCRRIMKWRWMPHIRAREILLIELERLDTLFAGDDDDA